MRRWLALIIALALPVTSSAQQGLDRKKVPPPGPSPVLHVPTWTKSALANGADLIVSEKHDLPLISFSITFLADHGFDAQYGARPLKRAIQRYVEDPLSERILAGEFGRGEEIEVDVAPEGDRLAFRALSGSKA